MVITMVRNLVKRFLRALGIDFYIRVQYYSNTQLLKTFRNPGTQSGAPIFVVAETEGGTKEVYQWVSHLEGWLYDGSISYQMNDDGIYMKKWGMEEVSRLQLIIWNIPEFNKQTIYKPTELRDMDISGY